jgi:hypothetical protein
VAAAQILRGICVVASCLLFLSPPPCRLYQQQQQLETQSGSTFGQKERVGIDFPPPHCRCRRQILPGVLSGDFQHPSISGTLAVAIRGVYCATDDWMAAAAAAAILHFSIHWGIYSVLLDTNMIC